MAKKRDIREIEISNNSSKYIFHRIYKGQEIKKGKSGVENLNYA
jgi:hypothetical protein